MKSCKGSESVWAISIVSVFCGWCIWSVSFDDSCFSVSSFLFVMFFYWLGSYSETMVRFEHKSIFSAQSLGSLFEQDLSSCHVSSFIRSYNGFLECSWRCHGNCLHGTDYQNRELHVDDWFISSVVVQKKLNSKRILDVYIKSFMLPYRWSTMKNWLLCCLATFLTQRIVR